MGKRLTQRMALRNAVGDDISDAPADADIQSQPLQLPIGKKWSLNIWFKNITVTGTPPKFTIYGASKDDIDSINPLPLASNIEAPDIVFMDSFPAEFIVVEYKSNGVTAGTKFIDLFIEK